MIPPGFSERDAMSLILLSIISISLLAAGSKDLEELVISVILIYAAWSLGRWAGSS